MVTTISPPIDRDLLRLRCEFTAMPGLCLTTRQTARLLSVREPNAGLLLEQLVFEGLLLRTAAGVYKRAWR